MIYWYFVTIEGIVGIQNLDFIIFFKIFGKVANNTVHNLIHLVDSFSRRRAEILANVKIINLFTAVNFFFVGYTMLI